MSAGVIARVSGSQSGLHGICDPLLQSCCMAVSHRECSLLTAGLLPTSTSLPVSRFLQCRLRPRRSWLHAPSSVCRLLLSPRRSASGMCWGEWGCRRFHHSGLLQVLSMDFSPRSGQGVMNGRNPIHAPTCRREFCGLHRINSCTCQMPSSGPSLNYTVIIASIFNVL